MTYNPFYEIAKRLFSFREPVRQPVPNVSEDDVRRIVQRDFPPEQIDPAMSVLREYGVKKCEGEHARVYLAALKLANGSLEKLKREIEAANRDFRDIIAAAEYPRYFRAASMVSMNGASRREKERIIAEDWQQYECWLRR